MRGVSGGNAGTVLSGNLKNIDTGDSVAAVFTSSATGTPDDFGGMAYPDAGTDAYIIFNGKVDLGNTQSGIGIRSSSGSNTRLTFSNLDPNKRYVLKGTAVRGNNYAGRWTLCTIEGADAFTDDHTAGSVYTAANYPSAGLSAGQAGFQSGENRANGAVVGWKEIDPGADGTFSVLNVQWTANPLPNGTAPDTATYGYGLCVIMLAEVEIGDAEAIIITNQIANVTVPERGVATFAVGASGSPKTYFWYHNGNPVPGNNQPTYSISSVTYPGNNGDQVFVIISNSLSFVNGTTATLTVTPDTVPPTVVSAIGDFALDTIRVTFSEPMQEGNITESSNWKLYETGTNPESSPFSQTAVLENGSNAVLTVSPPRTPGVNYSLRVSDQFDASSGANELLPNPTTIEVQQDIYLIATDGTKSFQVYQGGSLDGTGWQNVVFDDASWTPGLNVFSQSPAEASPPADWVIADTSLVPASAAGQNTIYFRTHFLLPALPTNAVVELFHWIDDGAVFYLNGKEITRFGIAADVAVNFSTAGANVAEPHTAVRFVIPATNLVVGDNVFAVEVHQTSVTSTDIAMGAQVRARVVQFESGPARIIGQPQSLVVEEGRQASISVFVGGAPPLAYQWRKGGSDLPGQTSSSYVIPAPLPTDTGDYTVVVANSLGMATSAVATLTVNADVTPPTIISAIADTNLSQIVLVFSEPVDVNRAQETGNYIVALTAGGGNIDIQSAVLINGTNVILTLDTPRTESVSYSVTITDIIDTSVAQNPVTPPTYALSSRVFLIAIDDMHEWRYEESGTDLGTAWTAPGYNDSAWLSGKGLFDVVRDSIRTVLGADSVRTQLSLTNATETTNSTYYFRTHFSLPSANTNGVVLELTHVMDDAIVVYLNGHEIYRLNITNNPVYYTNYATAAAVGTAARQGPFVIPITGLVSGDNVLAAEVHQVNMTSSDVTFGIELLGVIPVISQVSNSPRLNTTFISGSGQLALSWNAPPGFCLQETMALTGPTTIWVTSSVVSGVPFSASGSGKFYRLSNSCN